MNDLRAGVYDVLVGVNLLREGLDLPEVSLVAILDADKEGFLRSHRSLTQTAGRAARNVNGKVIMYADNITESMQRTIDETARRRTIQLQYNADHNITPRQIVKAITSALPTSKETEPTTSMQKTAAQRVYIEPEGASFAADPIVRSMSIEELQKSIANTTALMKQAAKDLDFMQAAQYRDEIIRLQKELEEKKRKPHTCPDLFPQNKRHSGKDTDLDKLYKKRQYLLGQESTASFYVKNFIKWNLYKKTIQTTVS